MGRESTHLLAAAAAYAAAALLAGGVAIRDDLPGEPLTVTVHLSVPAAVVVGWGSAVSPPWVMPVVAIAAARRAAAGSTSAAAVAASVGVVSLCGHLVEPLTYRPHSWSRSTTAAIAAMSTASALLAVSGLQAWRALRRQPGAGTLGP